MSEVNFRKYEWKDRQGPKEQMGWEGRGDKNSNIEGCKMVREESLLKNIQIIVNCYKRESNMTEHVQIYVL